jgi:Golgi nucleoside diphosphatase
VEFLSTKIKDDLRATNEKCLMLTAQFHLLNRNYDKAREFVKTVNRPTFLF